jgi:hypothetical protein
MASYKSNVRAAITAAVHLEFPQERVKSLREEGSLLYELEQWLDVVEDSFPSAWRRDHQAMGLKYALAALAGEGIQWEPKRVLHLYKGDIALCQVGSPSTLPLRQAGGYASRRGRMHMHRWYTPEMLPTQQQGRGDVAMVDGQLRHIAWPIHGAQLPEHLQQRCAFSDEEIMGDRYF